MKFQFIERHKQTYQVHTLCQMFGVTASGYYQWKSRGKSNREKENDYLLDKIKETYEMNRCVYGSPRITQALHREAIICSQPRVARLMRANGIVANISSGIYFYRLETPEKQITKKLVVLK